MFIEIQETMINFNKVSYYVADSTILYVNFDNTRTNYLSFSYQNEQDVRNEIQYIQEKLDHYNEPKIQYVKIIGE